LIGNYTQPVQMSVNIKDESSKFWSTATVREGLKIAPYVAIRGVKFDRFTLLYKRHQSGDNYEYVVLVHCKTGRERQVFCRFVAANRTNVGAIIQSVATTGELRDAVGFYVFRKMNYVLVEYMYNYHNNYITRQREVVESQVDQIADLREENQHLGDQLKRAKRKYKKAKRTPSREKYEHKHKRARTMRPSNH